MKRLVGAALFVTLMLLWQPARGRAWEIELQRQVSTRAAMVRLGDVGTISGLRDEDAALLRQIVLAPGPSKSFSRNLTASQIRHILMQHGVELEGCHFSGAQRSVVAFADPDTTQYPVAASGPAGVSQPTRDAPSGVLPVSYRATGGSAVVASVERQLGEIVQQRLQQLADSPAPWSVQVTIDRQALKDLPRQWTSVTIEGLGSAKEGVCQLVACFTGKEDEVRIPLRVETTRMIPLVVPIRPLKRGAVVRASDVEVRHIVRPDGDGMPVAQIDDIVGRQITAPIKEGEPIDRNTLQKPILVKRRDKIQVVARRGGIKVTMQALAIDDGAEGDTIAVERLDESKARFLARVTGYQAAEVFVGSAAAAPTTRRR